MSAPDIKPPVPTGGGVPIGGSGTTGTLAKFTASTTIGDSVLTEKAGAIATLTGATPAATNGTYSQLALTGGTGTGATADIVVSGGAVSSVVLRAPGNGYTVGDLLTCPTLTGLGVGVTVATVATVIAAVEGTANITASGRLGAFTPNPRAGLDVAAGGALIFGSTRYATLLSTGAINSIETQLAVVGSFVPSSTVYSIIVAPEVDAASWTGNPSVRGVNATPHVTSSAVAQTISVGGGNFEATRRYAADLSTSASTSMRGVIGTVSVQTGVGSAITAGSAACVFAQAVNTAATHTMTLVQNLRATISNAGTMTTAIGASMMPITGGGTIGTYYGLRIEATTAQTITTRYGISQEDTAAINVLASATRVGATTAPATNTLDVSTAAWGIKLATAPANGDANTLDAYREGTRALSAGDLSGWTYVTATQYWTLVGRTVTLHTVFTGGTSSATGGATIATPPLLTPLRLAAGVAVNSVGTALGSNGVCVVQPTTSTTGTVTTSTIVSSSNLDKVLTVTYETAGL